jgi:dUTPase
MTSFIARTNVHQRFEGLEMKRKFMPALLATVLSAGFALHSLRRSSLATRHRISRLRRRLAARPTRTRWLMS